MNIIQSYEKHKHTHTNVLEHMKTNKISVRYENFLTFTQEIYMHTKISKNYNKMHENLQVIYKI